MGVIPRTRALYDVSEAMDAAVKIDDIVDELEWRVEERPAFIVLDSGRVGSVDRELLHLAEELEDDEEPDIPEWQMPEYEFAREIVFGRFMRLPDQRELDEWSMMEDFAQTVPNARLRTELLDALQGRGAFGNFKRAARRNRLDKAWHAYRRDALRRWAIQWCERSGIPWK